MSLQIKLLGKPKKGSCAEGRPLKYCRFSADDINGVRNPAPVSLTALRRRAGVVSRELVTNPYTRIIILAFLFGAYNANLG
jgi:hypothetical protein